MRIHEKKKITNPYASVANGTVCLEGFQCSPGIGLGSRFGGCPPFESDDDGGTGANRGIEWEANGRPQQHLKN